MKQETHPLYEELRTTPSEEVDRQTELLNQMVEMSSTLEAPEGVETIGTIKKAF